MPEAFRHYIKTIGRGQRAGRTLTQEEAYHAMKMIIAGEATPDQRGAFLMLLRVREETPEELAGFVQAFREATRSQMSSLNAELDMGCYAGKRRHHPWFLLSVMALAQSGVKIFLHGTHEPDSNRLYLSDVLPDLGYPVNTSIDEAAITIEKFGFAYLDLAHFNPALDNIIQLRSEFGLRSCANTLARMLNPSQAPFSLQGVFHRHVDEKHRQTAALLQDQNVLCFRGEGGEIEYNPERDVTLHRCFQGKQACTEVPAWTDSRSLKNKVLDPLSLVQVWTGAEVNEYAESAIIGTLAIMLVLHEGNGWETSRAKAEAMWRARNKRWPAKINDNNANRHCFDTQGKRYAH